MLIPIFLMLVVIHGCFFLRAFINSFVAIASTHHAQHFFKVCGAVACNRCRGTFKLQEEAYSPQLPSPSFLLQV